MIKSLNTLLCEVTDMDRAVEFYSEIFGFKPGYVSKYWSEFKFEGFKVGLHPAFDSQPPTNPASGWVTCFEVEDILSFRSKLSGLGVHVSSDFHDTPSGVLLDFCDPDGNRLQVMQLGVKAAELARA